MPEGWGLQSYDECIQSLGANTFGSEEIACNASWDKVLCWPATPAGRTAKLPCPPFIPLDRSKFAHRVCGPNGTWEGSSHTQDGWTNYTDCYTEMTRDFYLRIASHIPFQQLKTHAVGSRILETVGLVLSVISLAASTFIFCYFRSIRSSHRIRIHRNLFISVIIYTVVLLIKNLDQLIALEVGGGYVVAERSISSKPFLCESMIVFVEFTKTAMFSWMLIQGLHLQITLASVFNVTPNYKLYYGLGWGIPFLLTAIWSIVNGLLNREVCWYAYPYQKYFWVLEGPRLVILLVNICILFSVVRMLIAKMRSNGSPETEQIKKAVKAMIFLLPPLGANNLLHCMWPPISSTELFAIYSYSSHFFSSFQGFFMALFFCFLNSEVNTTLRLHWNRCHQNRFSVSSGQVSNAKSPSTNVTSFSEITTSDPKERRVSPSSNSALNQYLIESNGHGSKR